MNSAELLPADSALPPLDQARRAFERNYLVRILTMTSGNVTHAARLAGRNRTEFYRLLDRHSLLPSSFKPSRRDDRREEPAGEPEVVTAGSIPRWAP
jgi:DNA-binding NtrC family response regulator